MSDSGVNPHLEGIISDFEALKRSFEVEDVDTSSHSSPGSRRTTNSPHRNAMSPTSIYYRDLGTAANNNNNLNYTQPRSIMGGGGSKTPEPVSRRSELSIDISSSSNKQVDNVTSPASTRFVTNSALKRPEVLGHSKTPEMSHKREVTFAKTPTDSPVIRRNEGNNNNGTSRTPEQNHARKFEPPSPGDVRKPDISITRAPPENNGHHPAVHHPHHPNPHHNTIVTTFRCSSPNHAGRKSPNPDRSEVNMSHSNMSESAKPHHPSPQGKGEKTHGSDFSYVGIDAILEQMRRKAMKQGFEFNIMVVGQSGLGKSTLMNTLFKSKVSRKSVQPNPEERIPKTIEIKSISHDVEEKGVRMKLTVIDTPGFGDQINNENCWQPIMKFINDQYEAYLQEEININRKKRIPDSRVHCCIYFIPPTGHCLRPLDVEFMRRLSKVVNIVPVIAKADTLTLEERDYFKQTIREELRANGIDVYPQKEFDEDADDRMINDKIREMIPFAVVGSDQEYQVNGKRILGRKTKWGTIEVENIAHCEFAYLRDLLIRTHMQNIKDITGSIHYETYRVRRLNESNGHFTSHPSDHPAVEPKTNGQPEEQPSALQANGVAAQHEALSHEM
ncbi:neuronal-specific septin-3-like isoform X1 [Xiphias gladius]|uniref:neuronal-specific septin-3-like isoform X1 n=2 Tax=Xiphias gladius TaxID=8245 RepID=UPI001A97F832|nr:neuronal-specific septin-3-like isoform X1 [Xiphias gladius]